MNEQHPLTDDICGQIADELNIFSIEDCMRVAYNVGEIKGSEDTVMKVIDWLRDNVDELLLSTDCEVSHRYLQSLKDEFIQSFVEAMRPQEDN